MVNYQGLKREKKETKTSKKIPGKSIIKSQQPTLTIKQKEIPSVLGDPNRFFKDEMEEVKRTMFLK